MQALSRPPGTCPDDQLPGVPKLLSTPPTHVLSQIAGRLRASRPMLFPMRSVNHMFPSGPVVIPPGPLLAVGIGPYSVTAPAGVTFPILFPFCSVNHRFPSGPAAIPVGPAPVARWATSVTTPAVLIFAIVSVENSVNHNNPSGPTVIWSGPLLAVGRPNSTALPAVLIRPIWFAVDSVNHRFPSGPGVIQKGPLVDVGRANSVTVPVGVIRPIWPPAPPPWNSANQRFPSGPATIPSGTLLAVRPPNSTIVPTPAEAGIARAPKSSSAVPPRPTSPTTTRREFLGRTQRPNADPPQDTTRREPSGGAVERAECLAGLYRV